MKIILTNTKPLCYNLDRVKKHGTNSIGWRHSQAVRRGSAKPWSPVQIWVAPPKRKTRWKSCLSFCVCVRRTQHRLRVYSQHHLTFRSTSFRFSGHKTTLPYGKQCCASHKRCGITPNDVALRANDVLRNDVGLRPTMLRFAQTNFAVRLIIKFANE